MASTLVTARESFSTDLDGKEVLVPLGLIVPVSHKLVKEHKDLFEPVEPRPNIEQVAPKTRRPKK